MTKPTQFLSAAIVGLASIATIPLSALAADQSVAEFDAKENQKLAWRVVDDGVMGGRSEGEISFSDSGILRFNGKLSLENNGGFSSLRTGNLELDLGGAKGLVARVKGDGRSYQMRLGTDARYLGMEVSFMAEFPTEVGEWTEVRVPFSEFAGSFRGRTLKDKVLDPSKIRRVGLLLGDKKAGPFELQVDWIRAYGSKTGNLVDAALADGRFKTLAAALGEAELVAVLQGDGPLTVFAPTDEAFAKLPEGTVAKLLKPENRSQLQAILKYHVIPGATNLAAALGAGEAVTVQGGSLAIAFADGKVRVNEATILNADIECSNGVIHVIDSVLLPPSPTPPPASNDILGVAKTAGKFGTLLAAVEAAGLTSVLSGDGPFTILAPTDEAFAALQEGTVENLLKKENLDQLRAILTYHALSGEISAGDALNASSAKTINGQPVEFAIVNGLFKVNGATVRSTDIACENGVIHVIDAVLLPPAAGDDTKSAKAKPDMTPAQRIEDAVERGVPVFNRGNHAECAKIYETCLKELIADKRLDAKLRQALEKILARGGGADSARDRAWLYRSGLDSAYEVFTAAKH